MENGLIKTATLTGLILMMALATTGCSKTPSSNVKTAGIHVSFTVEGNNQNAATCEARFQVGGATGTYLDLQDGDSVTCEGKTMVREEFAGIVVYRVPVSYNPRGAYTVMFTRPKESPYVSTVLMPEPIVGMNPVGFVGYQKGRPFSVAWAPSLNTGDEMRVELSYQAGNTSTFRYKSGGRPETGGVGFGAEDTTTNPPQPGTVSGKITYHRVRNGYVPSPLSGTIQGVQTFSVPVQFTD